jgi:hypothetical protein
MPQKRVLFAILLVIFAALLGLVFIKNLIDFPVYYAAGRSLIGGRTDLYAPDFALGQVMDYRYPPIFLIPFIPLWHLPYKVAAYFWTWLSILQIAGCVLLLKNSVVLPEIPSRVWVMLFFITGQYFIMILHYGNAHLLAIFFLIASIYLARIRKRSIAAFLLALAITIKLTPGLFLLYFAIKKEWKFLGLIGAFIVAINLLPSLYFGVDQSIELHRTWFSHVVVNQAFHEENGPINLSLKGQLRRYFTEVDYSQRVDGDTRYPKFNLLSLSPQTVDGLWIAISILVVVLVLVLIFISTRAKMQTGEEPRSIGYLTEVGLFICLMLFIGPLTSKIYFIALLVPAFALCLQASQKPTSGQRRILLFIALLNSLLPLLPGRWLQRWFLVLGVDFFVNLLLMLLLAVDLFRRQITSQGLSDGPQKPAP